MSIDPVELTFEMIAFLFAISVHESAHAWTASRCGDPTARMLGRVSLNPIRHIDPIGTILLPLVAVISHIPVLGWAKPTPVDPRNFRNLVLDDILTSVAGPVSNFLVATAALLLLGGFSLSSTMGRAIVGDLLNGLTSNSSLFPFAKLLYELMYINIVLAIFNLIPVPPLDGSHVIRHFMTDTVRRTYDRIGIFALLALVLLGGNLIWSVVQPVWNAYKVVLVKF